MRVFDCTIINDELDMLELRFRTLEDVVDTFIVAEALQTHSGQPKLLHLWRNLDHFARWRNRLHIITVHLTETNSWLRERQQRG